MKYKLDRAALGALVTESVDVDRLAGQRLAIMYDAADGNIWSDFLTGNEHRFYTSDSIICIGIVYERHTSEFYIKMLENSLEYCICPSIEPGWHERWGIEV